MTDELIGAPEPIDGSTGTPAPEPSVGNLAKYLSGEEYRYPQAQPRGPESVLDLLPLDRSVKADAWVAYHSSPTPHEFQQNFDALPLPREAKADLFDLKFNPHLSSAMKGGMPIGSPQPVILAAGTTGPLGTAAQAPDYAAISRQMAANPPGPQYSPFPFVQPKGAPPLSSRATPPLSPELQGPPLSAGQEAFKESLTSPSAYAGAALNLDPTGILPGAAKVATGTVKAAAPASTMRERAGGLHEALGGAMEAASVLIPEQLLVNPVQTAKILGAAVIAGQATTAGLKHLGIAPEYSDLAGDIAAIVAGYGAHWASAPPEVKALVEATQQHGPTGNDAIDFDLMDKLSRMAAQHEQSPHEARIAREILRQKYGFDIPEPEPGEAPEAPGAAPMAEAQPGPTVNTDAFTKAHGLWHKTTTEAAGKFMEEHPGVSWEQAQQAVAGTTGLEPQPHDYVATAPPPEPAPPAPAPEKPEPPQKVAKVGPGTKNPPTAALPTEPESEATLAAQLQQLAEGKRKVVMFPGGIGQPTYFPPGIDIRVTNDGLHTGNTYAYRGDMTDAGAIRHAAAKNELPQLLGHSELGMGTVDKSQLQPGPQLAVTGHAPDGTEVQTAATDTANLPTTIEATKALTPAGGTVTIRTPEEALRDRQAQQGAHLEQSNVGSPSPVAVQPAGSGPGVGAAQTLPETGLTEREPVSGLPGPGDSGSVPGQPEPVAGGEGDGIRRVTGSADPPLTPKGDAQVTKEAAEKTVQPWFHIFAGPQTRARQTAEKFGPFTTRESLAGWARAEAEGQPAHEVSNQVAQWIRNPDAVPPGVSPFSGKPGKSWNQMAIPLLKDVQGIAGGITPDERVLLVTSGGNIQVIDAWANAGYPDDFNIDREALATKPYTSVTGKMFRLGPQGLEEVQNNAQPGVYITEHGITQFNPKVDGKENGVATEDGQPHDTEENITAPKSYKYELQIHGEGDKWHQNAVAFPTREEAEAAGQDKFSAWMMATNARTVESDEPPNYNYAEGKLQKITEPIVPPVPVTPEDAPVIASPPTVEDAPADQPGHIKLANAVLRKLQNNEVIGDNAALQKIADVAFGGTRASGAYRLKEAHDAVEAAVNRYIADSIGQNLLTGDFAYALEQLRDLLSGLPTQNVRTDEQVSLQQFSTPPTLSYLAARAAAMLPRDIVLEPSAGTGSLAAFAHAADAIVHTNEIDQRRIELLKWVLRGNDPTSVDGELLHPLLPVEIQPTVVLMNPPFSSTGGRVAHNSNEVGYRHVINGLLRLQQGGRLVAILGEGAKLDAPNARQFWRDIAKRGGLVRANVGISGKEYTKYGTTFGNRLIVIDKANAVDFSEQLGRPASLIPISGDFDTIEEAYDAIQSIIGERPASTRPATGVAAVAAPGGELPGTTGNESGTGRSSGAAIQPAGAGETGTGISGGKSGSGGSPGLAGQPAVESGDTPTGTAIGLGGSAPAGNAGSGGVGAAGAAGVNPQDLIDAVIRSLQSEGVGNTPAAAVSAPSAPAPKPRRGSRTRGRGGNVQPPVALSPAKSPVSTPLDAAADKALQELRDMLGGNILARPRDPAAEPPAAINPAILERLTLVGARAMLAGATAYNDWSRAMVEQAGDVLAVVSTRSRMPGDALLLEIHGYAAAAAKHFGVEAEAAPAEGEESIIEPPRNEDLVTLEARKQEDMDERVEDDGAFVQYVPSINGLAHPGVVVETKVMASVGGPPITYNPNLPADVIANSPKPLSAVQMEAIARAGQSHSAFNETGERLGFLLGDGTGLGKGQEIAGIIWDNNRQGRKRAIWLSGSADLKEQATGDFIGVGAVELSKQLHSVNEWKNGQDIDLPEGVLFSTYSTLQTEASQTGGISRRQQIMNWLGPDGVIIFDEAQKGKNAVPGDQQVTGSKAGRAVVKIQADLPGARVAYVSATAATEVRNLGYMTRLGLWGRGTPFHAGFQQFMSEVGNGGIAAMELIAREMKAAGRYLSRSISYKGISFDEKTHELSSEQEQIYDTAAEAWQNVLQGALDQVKDNGGGAMQQRQLQNSIWGEHQRFFRALLTAMKTPTLFDMIDKALNDPQDPKAIIVSLIGTGQAQGERQLAAVTDQDDELDFSPREILVNVIRRVYPIHLMQEVTDPHSGETSLEYVMGPDGKRVENPAAVAARDALIKHLEATLALPESPLDQIISTYGRDQVAEITSRRNIIRRNPATGSWEKASRAPDGVRMDDINKYEKEQFQSGKKNILVMSKAGGTGFSFHADLSALNQRKRLQIALELSWSADDQVQAFGRSHRSNQRVPPEFVILSTNAGGEKRFSSSIARRLESLGALTKGQRDASGGSSVLAKYNFETQEGIVAANAFYNYLLQDPEIPGSPWNGLDILRKMSVLDEHIDEHTGEPDGTPPSVPRTIRENVKKLLNRILNVQFRAQNGIYDLFTGFFDEAVQAAIEAGRLDTGVNLVRGDHVRLTDRRVIATDPETKAQTYRYVIEVDSKNKPVPVEFVKDLHDRQRGHMMRRREYHGPQFPNQLIWVERSNQPITTRSGNVERAYKMFGPGHRENARDYQRISESDLNQNYEPIEGASRQEQLTRLDASIKSNEKALEDLVGAEDSYSQRRKGYLKEQIEDDKNDRKALWSDIRAARENQWDEWQKAHDSVPAGRTDRIDMIGGSVMRIWSHLNVGRGRMDIRIAYPDSGGSITGVVMSEGDANAVESALTGRTIARTTASIFRSVLAGAERFNLVGGLRLQQTRIGRDTAIEVVTSDPYAQRFLTANGVTKEIVNYRSKYYIPNDPATGIPVLEKVLKQFPVMADGSDGNNALGRPRIAVFAPLDNLIEAKLPAKASPAQILAVVGNQKNGLKTEQVRFADWLKAQHATITRDQILAFVRGNAIGQALFRPRDLKNYTSPRDFANADARFEKPSEGNGHVYVNHPAIRLLAEMFGRTDSWGFTIPPEDYEPMVKDLRAKAATASVTPDEAKAAAILLPAIEAAHADDPVVTFVDAGPRSPEKEILRTEREEAFHRAQIHSDLAAGHGRYTDVALLDIPDITAAVDKLRKARRDYSDQVALVELGAMLGTAQGDDIGLNIEQSAGLLRIYMDALIKAHGPTVGKILKFAAPQIRRELGKQYVEKRWDGEDKSTKLERPRLQRSDVDATPAGSKSGVHRKAEEADAGKNELQRPRAEELAPYRPALGSPAPVQ